jgi:dTDP-4-amino-4,6-dideoxygalactose transaminase
MLDLTAQYRAIAADVDRAVLEVLARGQFINGPNVRAFEGEFAQYVGALYGIGVNSGTDALHLALRALDIGPGDEVVTTPFTFVATTEAIGIVGARPVFVDIDPATHNLDPAAIEAAITPRTKAILPVHLYGAPAAMPQIMAIAHRYGLAVVEDCAQATGAAIGGKRVGTFGTFGCFSFFPSKNLGAYGDGGMVTTDSPELAARVKALRAHGGRVKYHHEELGVNSRLDEVQAAVLRVKLRHLESWTERRRARAKHYDAAFAVVPDVVVPAAGPGTRHVYHQYTLRVRVRVRDALQRELHDAGVQTMIYYPVPLHRQAVHASLGHASGAFPCAETAAREVLSLPMYPELSDADAERVIAAVRAAGMRSAAWVSA